MSTKKCLSILYLGPNHGTSRHRADALTRLGHTVMILDPWDFFPRSSTLRKFLSKFIYEAGAQLFEPYIYYRLKQFLSGKWFDVIWSNQCIWIGQSTAWLLRKHAQCMVSYTNDDPFGNRDKKLFTLYRKAVSQFDLMAVLRKPNVSEAYQLGAKDVIRVCFSADEVAHRPLETPPEETARWESEVVFVGTWMPERGAFLARLLELGVPLTIYGDRWHKAREWPTLKKAWRGPGLVGDDYVRALQCAKVCLGLLSKGNRDLHTRRSAEVPHIGSVLCAERTEEHLAMYEEDVEAVFWSTPEECAEKCLALLADEPRRKAIARAGRQRCIRSGYLNEPVMQRILEALLDKCPSD